MQSTIHAAPRRGHLSRHERQGLARAAAFSRRTAAMVPDEVPVKLRRDELELLDRLVRADRTAVSSAVLAIAGIGSARPVRRAVLELVGEAACRAETEGEISAERGEQIARHVRRALDHTDVGIAA
jgi:hypothetical protein